MAKVGVGARSYGERIGSRRANGSVRIRLMPPAELPPEPREPEPRERRFSGVRLLLLAERFPPDIGGLARSGARIAQALAAMGCEVDVLAWTRILPPGRLESSDVSSAPVVVLHRLGLFGNLDFSMQHTLNVLEWLHGERRFAAVWGHYLVPCGFVATLFAEQAGLPSTVSARGNDFDRTLFPPGDLSRLLWTLERATVVSAVSRDLARRIDVVGGRELGVEVIGNAVDLEVFSPGPVDVALRTALGIGEDEAVLGFCGELRMKKGLPFLLDALVEVRRQRPACLLVIGELRPRQASMLAAFGAEHPQDHARVLFTGHLEEPAHVAAHLRLCDVVLSPSVWEGLPNAVLEAMACGCLVLGSDAGGIPEIVEHGVSGAILARHELHRLGPAALELLQLDATARQALRSAARGRVETRFGPANERAALTRVLERLGL
jgi:glycosyltransferase involved in cell wall biosynthesis